MDLGLHGGDALVAPAVVAILERYASATDEAANASPHDPGPVVLAYLAHESGILPAGLGRRVALRWLNEQPRRIRALGVFGGLGGWLAGLHVLPALDPEFAQLPGLLVERTRQILGEVEWRHSSVAWADYDLFRGPAGLVLAGATGQNGAESVIPAARHLAKLCDVPELERLRAGPEIYHRSAFNIGRINTGMGHGVTGVASALLHAVETVPDGTEYVPALRHCCDWLMEQAYLADGDFITWPPVGRDGGVPARVAHRRQSWCYGTPGVAWTLWDAGRVLDDASLRLLGNEAMRSFCRIFTADRYFDTNELGEELAICHGAAGTLAVADAFARHAELPEAQRLRDELASYLLARLDDLNDVAHGDMTLLNGAAGVCSVLLTVRGGARDWLRLIALR